MKPVIYGLSGLELTDEERSFFREAQPAGYILFGRNIESRAQLRRLTDDLKSLHANDRLPILIDQEGGRVARMKPPEWPAFPAGGTFDALYDVAPMSAIEAARVNALAIGLTLAEVGITVNCMPLLDVRVPETHAAIGDRALGSEAKQVAALGRAELLGLAQAGVVGVVKHIPGHGRANVDSHYDLPRVTADAAALAQDIAPFRTLNDAPMAMTGHILFDVWDTENCATMSPRIIEDIIRGEIGFDGLLMSDDLDMQALSGDVSQRAAACIAAGCDIALNCWGRMDEMIRIADALPEITAKARERLNAAMQIEVEPEGEAQLAEMLAKRDALLAQAGADADAKLTQAATGASHG